MIFIGITGGIGSGKSLVCSLFEKKNIPVFYADDVAKKILDSDEVKEKVVSVFGSEVLNNKGLPDRKKISEIVFSDSKKLQRLNSIIHPRVFVELEKWKLQQKDHSKYFLIEAALIFESSMEDRLDYVLSVVSDPQIRIERVMSRDKSGEEEVRNRMKSQFTDEELMKRSDFVLYNNESVDALKSQLNFFHVLFLTLKKPKEVE